MEIQDSLVKQDQLVSLELMVLQGLLETQELLAPLVKQEIMDLKDQEVSLVRQDLLEL